MSFKHLLSQSGRFTRGKNCFDEELNFFARARARVCVCRPVAFLCSRDNFHCFNPISLKYSENINVKIWMYPYIFQFSTQKEGKEIIFFRKCLQRPLLLMFLPGWDKIFNECSFKYFTLITLNYYFYYFNYFNYL